MKRHSSQASQILAVSIGSFYATFLLFDIIWAMSTTWSGFQFPIGWLTKLALATLLVLPVIVIRRKWYLCVMGVLTDIFLIANLMYFRTYYTVIPLSSYGLAGNLSDFQASVWESLRWCDLLFPAITVVMMWLLRKADLRVALRHLTRRIKIVLACCVAVPILVVTIHSLCKGGYKAAYEDLMYDYSSCGAAYYTIPGTWAYELVAGTPELTPELRDEIDTWLSEQPEAVACDTIKPRANIIIILCESLESWVLQTKVDGIEITPNLNRYLAESDVLYAPHVLSQVKGARSIDAQLILHTGLLPVNYGAYSSRFPHHTYMSLDKAFKEHHGDSALTMSMTVDKRIVWNAGIVAQDFGYDILLDKPHFELDVKSGPRGRLADHSFFRQAADKLETEQYWRTGGHTLVQLVTYSGHTPFVIPEELRQVEFDTRYPDRLRNYMTVANYTDRAIGELIDRLRANPKFDDTMIVITGDHEGIGVDRAKMVRDPEVANFLSDQQFVPFIVLNSPVSGRYDEVMGQIDIYPTLLDLAGLGEYQWRGVGQSILDSTRPPYAVSAQGEIIGVADDNPQRQNHKRKAYDISDKIISTDYFKFK